MITAIGAPVKGYNTVEWQIDGKGISEPLPFILMAWKHKVDHLIILGTNKSFDETYPHYIQLTESLKKYGLDKKYNQLLISDLKNTKEFWDAFHIIIDNREFMGGKVELYVDLTFGYRIQPMLIFLAAFFLNEMNERVSIKKVYYGMQDAQPPQIVDMTELMELLEWMKAAQLFTTGGSAELLVEKIKRITGSKYSDVAEDFREFTDAYAFNYVSYLTQKASQFQKRYKNKDFRRDVRNNFPVFGLIHKYILDFINLFTDDDKLAVQLKAVRKNMQDGAFSRSVIILRETYITLFMEVFGFNNNLDREKVERVLINRVYWFITDEPDKPVLSEFEMSLAKDTLKILQAVFSEKSVQTFFKEWGKIRKIRNGAGHVKNIVIEKNSRLTGNTTDENSFYNKFKGLRAELEFHIKETGLLFNEMTARKPEAEKFSKEIRLLLDNQIDSRLFVIVNDGIHPVLKGLQMQYGDNIRYKILTTGNTTMDAEKEIALMCRKISEEYPRSIIYLVPSGFPYLAIAAYNVFQQSLSKHPVWLQFDRENGKYLEKNLDPRELLTI